MLHTRGYGMNASSIFHRIVAGQAGVWAIPARALLRMAEGVYSAGVAIRNRRYDRAAAPAVMPVPVISVGNLTAGGTGKTPLVIDLVGRLERMGFSPAVVSRGYKATHDQPNDEERMIRTKCPSVVCVSNPDRVLAAEIACGRYGADVIVLDDAFQHRRIHRALDFVAIDASCPFGWGHLLPRGLLREPVRNLARAHVVVITRCDQVSAVQLAAVDERVRRVAPNALHVQCTHQIVGIERLNGTPADESLEGKRAVLFAGIGRPEAFATTVRSVGIEVVGERWWGDHHRYRRGDIDSMLKAGRLPPHDVLLTTEKDAAKLALLGNLDHAGILVVKIAIDFTGHGSTIVQSVLDKTLDKG